MPYLSQIMLLSVSLFHRIAALAGVAQLVERLTCNEDVVGSTPVTGSKCCPQSRLNIHRAAGVFILHSCFLIDWSF